MKDKLKAKLKNIKKCFNEGPYTIIVSDDAEIRNYFIKNLYNNVNILENYNLYYPKRMLIYDKLKQNHVLLLNFEQKVKEYIAFNNICGEEDMLSGLHNALIGFKDKFYNYGRHTIVIVCDNKMASDILKNLNLKSAVNAHFMDLELSKKQLNCYLFKDDSKIFQHLIEENKI